MTPSDWAAWVQAVGSIIAIAVAIFVPWKIHQSRQAAAQRITDSYRSLLREAFTNLSEPIVYLHEIGTFNSGEDSNVAGSELLNPKEDAANLRSAIDKMNDAQIVIKEIEDLRRLDDFKSIIAIFDLRRTIAEAQPEFERERAWLEDYGDSAAVVRRAIRKLGSRSSDLRLKIDRVLQAL
jgi:hypothetical protein